jgi:uncharacterized protein (DUF427 family)
MTETREHPHRLHISSPNHRAVVSKDGVVLAETKRAIVLREGSLPPRYYIPRDDVRMKLLEPTASRTHCPFKGDASYWSYGKETDIAWSYATPIPDAAAIAGMIAFYNDRVTLEVDQSPS